MKQKDHMKILLRLYLFMVLLVIIVVIAKICIMLIRRIVLTFFIATMHGLLLLKLKEED